MPAWLGPVLGGALSLFGGQQGNKASAKQAQLNRDFQERMSNTSHQREVADLKAAGLNPILSANKGSSTPGGNMALQKDTITPALSSAMQASQVMQDLKNKKAQKVLTDNQAATALQTAKSEIAKQGLIDAQTKAIAPAALVGDKLNQLNNHITGELQGIEVPGLLDQVQRDVQLGVNTAKGMYRSVEDRIGKLKLPRFRGTEDNRFQQWRDSKTDISYREWLRKTYPGK